MASVRAVFVSMFLIGLTSGLAAQNAVAPAQAAPFLGTWSITLESPQGANVVMLTVKATDGKVAGEIGSEVMPAEAITDVSSVENGLVLKYTRAMGRNSIPVKITLKPRGAEMTFQFDMADGQMVLDGVAVKKP